ncbi:MAG TPA: class I SAM-dependent methyltransferase [Candidatus Acidoferrales bacterium]|nr:class I SAM-dependent methyltransferase [Candidatus Acidoferrales bacterium]
MTAGKRLREGIVPVFTPSRKSAPDFLKWLVFELGAGYYARKLATGPEADLRRDFAEFFLHAIPGGSGAPVRVLDVGCGPGHLARHLSLRGCQVTAVDRSTRLIRIARRWATREGVYVDFQNSPANSLPFPDRSFDASCATTVIYFVNDAAQVLREMARVTKPGGIVATLDPSASMTVSAVREYGLRHRLSQSDRRKLNAWAVAAQFNRRFSESDLTALLQSAGLSHCLLEPRLDGLVWFARGSVPESP